MRQHLLTLLLCLATAAWALPGSAQEDKDWRVTVNFPMAWLPDVSGKIYADGDRTDVDVSISDILDNLDAGFIGELYFQKGPWGLGWRSMFLGTKSDFKTEAVTGLPGPLPPIIGQHRIKVENELFTSDLIASYQFTDWFGAYTGVRRTGNKTRGEIRPLEPGLIEIEGRRTVIDEELFDWVVGIDLIHRFNQHWWASAQMDLGIDGDNDENQQINAFVSYDFNQRHSLWFGYRYLKIVDRFTDDVGARVKTEFTQQGPTIGWAWSF